MHVKELLKDKNINKWSILRSASTTGTSFTSFEKVHTHTHTQCAISHFVMGMKLRLGLKFEAVYSKWCLSFGPCTRKRDTFAIECPLAQMTPGWNQCGLAAIQLAEGRRSPKTYPNMCTYDVTWRIWTSEHANCARIELVQSFSGSACPMARWGRSGWMDIPGKQTIKVWSGPHSDEVLLQCLQANGRVWASGVACQKSVCSNIHSISSTSMDCFLWKRISEISFNFKGPAAYSQHTNVLFVRLCFSVMLMSSPAARTSRRKMGRPSDLTGHLGSSRRMPLECESFTSTPWLTVKSSSHVHESGHWWWKHMWRAGWKPPYLLSS